MVGSRDGGVTWWWGHVMVGSRSHVLAGSRDGGGHVIMGVTRCWVPRDGGAWWWSHVVVESRGGGVI